MPRMYVFRGDGNLTDARQSSPRLFAYLNTFDRDLELVPWDGALESLPTSESVFVQAPRNGGCGIKPLGEFCADYRHVAFKEDRSIRRNGSCASLGELLGAVDEFFRSLRRSRAS